MSKFEFSIGQSARIRESRESGIIVSRAEHQSAENNYLLRYKNNQGIAVEQWWTESALEAA